MRTWYAAIETLEASGLLAVVRAGRAKRICGMQVTRRGKRLLESVEAISHILENSEAALKQRLRQGLLPSGSLEAGDVLCRLVEHGERRGDAEAFPLLAATGLGLARRGEALLAVANEALHGGRLREALGATVEALDLLSSEPNSRSFRKALLLKGSALDYLGDIDGAYREALHARALARKSSDPAQGAEAALAMAVCKGRLQQWDDASKGFSEGLRLSRVSGRSDLEAKLAANKALLDFRSDPALGIDTGQSALAAAADSANRLLIARAHLGMALMYAAVGHSGAIDSQVAAGHVGHPARNPLWSAAVRIWQLRVATVGAAPSKGLHDPSVRTAAIHQAFPLVRAGPVPLAVEPQQVSEIRVA